MTGTDMSPADFAAVNGNNNNGLFGGDWSAWIILFLIFGMFGGGWGGGFGGSMNAAVTNADLQRGFDQNATIGHLDALGTAVNNGFANAEISRCNGTQNLMQELNGIAMAQQNCCCENRAAVADLKYTVATENCADRAALSTGVRDIIDSQNAGFRSILDKLCQNEIDALKQRNADQLAEINALRFAQSQTAQNGYIASLINGQTQILNPAPIPAYVVQSPYCCNSGGNTGCGTCGRV